MEEFLKPTEVVINKECIDEIKPLLPSGYIIDYPAGIPYAGGLISIYKKAVRKTFFGREKEYHFRVAYIYPYAMEITVKKEGEGIYRILRDWGEKHHFRKIYQDWACDGELTF